MIQPVVGCGFIIYKIDGLTIRDACSVSAYLADRRSNRRATTRCHQSSRSRRVRPRRPCRCLRRDVPLCRWLRSGRTLPARAAQCGAPKMSGSASGGGAPRADRVRGFPPARCATRTGARYWQGSCPRPPYHNPACAANSGSVRKFFRTRAARVDVIIARRSALLVPML